MSTEAYILMSQCSYGYSTLMVVCTRWQFNLDHVEKDDNTDHSQNNVLTIKRYRDRDDK